MVNKINDLSGHRFGRLVAIHPTKLDSGRRMLWHCKCDCGSEREVASSHLRSGNSTSCGCLRKENFNSRTHGKTRTDEFRTWLSMRGRCENKKHGYYHIYGARGISVCERWQKFENFLEDMGQKQSPKHSIDRINNEDGYNQGNCRWATSGEQSRNKRTNVMITHDGVTKCVRDWSIEMNLNFATLMHRIKRGWPIGDALLKPPGPTRPKTKRVKHVEALEAA